MTIRFDNATVRKTRRDSDGFLYAETVVGRTGILEYRKPDGTVWRELRLPEEAGHPDTLASMAGKPIVVLHQGKMVDAKDARSRTVGTLLNGRQDDSLTVANVVVYDGDAQNSAEKGDTGGWSLGYRLDLEPRPGYYSEALNEISDSPKDGFKPFDAIQRGLRINHLAFVPKGRAGNVARLNFDGDEIINHEEPAMPKIKLADGTEVEVAQNVADHVLGMQTRLDAADTSMSASRGAIAVLEQERNDLKAKVEGFGEQLKQARLDAADEMKASAALAASVAHKVTDVAGKSDHEVRTAFIKAVMPSVNMDGMDEAAVTGAFAVALASNPAPANGGNGGSGDKGSPQKRHTGSDRLDGNDGDKPAMTAADARQRMIDKQMGRS